MAPLGKAQAYVYTYIYIYHTYVYICNAPSFTLQFCLVDLVGFDDLDFAWKAGWKKQKTIFSKWWLKNGDVPW